MKRGHYIRKVRKVACYRCNVGITTKSNFKILYCDKCKLERKKEILEKYLMSDKAKKVRYKYSVYYRKIGKRSIVMKNRRDKRRETALKELGGKCFVCGYKKYLVSLDIHHKDDGKNKKRKGDPEWWRLDFNDWGIFVLLCRNCHHAYHHGELERSW